MGLGIPLIVIVIFLVVWIVSNVLRAQQDAAQAAAKRTLSRPVGASQPLPAQKGNSEIDRFLQEIDRLRRKGQPDQTQSKAESASPPESERPRVREQPRRVAPERKKTSLATRKPAQSAKADIAQPKVEPLLPTPEPLPEPPPMEVMPGLQIVKPISFIRPTVTRTNKSPAMAALTTLFRSGQGPAVAVLLHEILSDPKCRK